MRNPRVLLAALALGFAASAAFAQKIPMQDDIDKTSDETLAKGEIPGQFPGYAWAHELSALELLGRGKASLKAGNPELAKIRYTGALALLEVIRACGLREAEDPPREVMIKCELESVQKWPVYKRTGDPDIDSKMPPQKTGPKPDAEKIRSWHDYGNRDMKRSYDAFVDSLHEALDGIKAADEAIKKKAKKSDKPANK